mmetsp:Transcript_84396/g.239854  ORF Transcript_84396/g.239854 Transcript_84396/m.239854 type:complete len:221 (+) Transcript_84396:64-726(+)
MPAYQASESKVGRDAPCHVVAPGLRATVVDAYAVPPPSHSCEHPHVACPRGSAEERRPPSHKINLDGQCRKDIHLPIHGPHVKGHAATGAALDHDAGTRRKGFVRQLEADDLAERHPRRRGDPPELGAVMHAPRRREDREEVGREGLTGAAAQDVRHQLHHLRQFVSEVMHDVRPSLIRGRIEVHNVPRAVTHAEEARGSGGAGAGACRGRGRGRGRRRG